MLTKCLYLNKHKYRGRTVILHPHFTHIKEYSLSLPALALPVMLDMLLCFVFVQFMRSWCCTPWLCLFNELIMPKMKGAFLAGFPLCPITKAMHCTQVPTCFCQLIIVCEPTRKANPATDSPAMELTSYLAMVLSISLCTAFTCC